MLFLLLSCSLSVVMAFFTHGVDSYFILRYYLGFNPFEFFVVIKVFPSGNYECCPFHRKEGVCVGVLSSFEQPPTAIPRVIANAIVMIFCFIMMFYLSFEIILLY